MPRSQKYNRTLTFSQAKRIFFLADLASPFADCYLGMTIVVKSNRGEEPSTACWAYRNNSICWLEETQGHVTPELDVRGGCVSKLKCERHVLPLLHSDGWQKVASATSFNSSLSLLNRSTPAICMYVQVEKDHAPIREHWPSLKVSGHEVIWLASGQLLPCAIARVWREIGETWTFRKTTTLLAFPRFIFHCFVPARS